LTSKSSLSVAALGPPRENSVTSTATRLRTPSPSSLSPAEQKLLSFEDVEALAALYDVLGWTLTEEITLYVDLARTAATDAARLRALKMLRDVRLDAMKLAGVIGQVKAVRKTTDETGGVLSESVIAQLIKKGGSIDAIVNPIPRRSPTSEAHEEPAGDGNSTGQDALSGGGDASGGNTKAGPALRPSPCPGAIPGLAVSSPGSDPGS
jgi:hypothetical protein